MRCVVPAMHHSLQNKTCVLVATAQALTLHTGKIISESYAVESMTAVKLVSSCSLICSLMLLHMTMCTMEVEFQLTES